MPMPTTIRNTRVRIGQPAHIDTQEVGVVGSEPLDPTGVVRTVKDDRFERIGEPHRHDGQGYPSSSYAGQTDDDPDRNDRDNASDDRKLKRPTVDGVQVARDHGANAGEPQLSQAHLTGEPGHHHERHQDDDEGHLHLERPHPGKGKEHPGTEQHDHGPDRDQPWTDATRADGGQSTDEIVLAGDRSTPEEEDDRHEDEGDGGTPPRSGDVEGDLRLRHPDGQPGQGRDRKRLKLADDGRSKDRHHD
jgi:hypothetical protein